MTKPGLHFLGPGSMDKCHVLERILRDIPAVNASIEGENGGDTIVYRDYVDISVAVATEKGLVTPVVRNAESMDMVGIEKSIADMGKKVHAPPPFPPLPPPFCLLTYRLRNRLRTPEGSDGTPEKMRASRTTEAERLAYFQNHPDVAEVEPHRVLCKCCEKWLKLHPTSRYGMAPWKAHNLICSPGCVLLVRH